MSVVYKVLISGNVSLAWCLFLRQMLLLCPEGVVSLRQISQVLRSLYWNKQWILFIFFLREDGFIPTQRRPNKVSQTFLMNPGSRTVTASMRFSSSLPTRILSLIVLITDTYDIVHSSVTQWRTHIRPQTASKLVRHQECQNLATILLGMLRFRKGNLLRIRTAAPQRRRMTQLPLQITISRPIRRPWVLTKINIPQCALRQWSFVQPITSLLQLKTELESQNVLK